VTHAGRHDGKEFMASLAKGLAVLRAFGAERPSMSLSEAAAAVGMSRAAARRVLLTLSELGYVVQDGRDFTPSPLVLELGFSYLSIQSWVERAEPLLKAISLEHQDSCFAAMLHGADIVIVARASSTASLMSMTMAVGTRLPAFHTALGRIQLGLLPEQEIWARLRTATIKAYTPNTIIDPGALVERVQSDARQGFSLVDEELERGLRSVAVAVVRRNGSVAGAISVSAHASRTTRNEMRDNFLPALKAAAERIAQGTV
jgi:IclR family pca regulon transcriptional regulator